MRHCLALCGAAALFLSPVLGESLRGQEQQQPPPPRPGVQVGVPEGRGGAPANPAGRWTRTRSRTSRRACAAQR